MASLAGSTSTGDTTPTEMCEHGFRSVPDGKDQSLHQKPRIGKYVSVSKNPQPVSKNPQPVSKNPQPVSKNPQPVSKNPQPVSKNPQSVSKTPK